jgi:hypothetical protein
VNLRGRYSPVELFDADRFLVALEITRSPVYSTYEEWKERVGEFELFEAYRDETGR